MAPTEILYYSPTTCGAANFIAAHKAGLIGTKLNAVEVNIGTHKLVTGPNAGADFFKYNPKGNVPSIGLDNGLVLNENVATLSYIADLAGTELAPANGTKERYAVLNYLSLIATEIHKAIYFPLFSAKDSEKAALLEKSKAKLTFLDTDIKGKHYLVGDKFTIADSYLYICLGWSKYVGVDLASYPNLQKYYDHIAGLDFVKAGHKAMADLSPKA